MLPYIGVSYIIPILLTILTVGIFFFIVGQFFFEDRSWNLAVKFFEWVKTTYFGNLVGDFVYVIDVVLLGIEGFALKKWMKNPFDRDAKESFKSTLVERYMRKNKIGVSD